MRFTTKNEAGFSLTEIIVAIAIFLILLSIAVPAFMRQRAKGTEAQVESALLGVRTELVQAQLMSKGTFPPPPSGTLLPAGIENGQDVAIQYRRSADGKKICLTGTKKGIVRYLDTASRNISTTACTV